MELIRRAQDGDWEALNRLFERYYDRVLRIVRLRMGTELSHYLESQDLLQETFLVAIQAFDRFQMSDHASFINWLARLAERQVQRASVYYHARKRDRHREQALQHLRVALSSGEIKLEPSADLAPPLEELANAEQVEILEDCLKDMRDDYREVLILRNYVGGSWSYIADELERPSEEAARKLYRRAKLDLLRRIRVASG
jgi:RNA polymerase sigma-70 factor (ECF subfamily)